MKADGRGRREARVACRVASSRVATFGKETPKSVPPVVPAVDRAIHLDHALSPRAPPRLDHRAGSASASGGAGAGALLLPDDGPHDVIVLLRSEAPQSERRAGSGATGPGLL